MSDIKQSFKALFLIGALLLLLGFILTWIPQSGISGLNQQLSQATLNSDKASLEQVISAENLNLVTFYQPLSNILQAVGGIMIAYSVLSTTFNIAVEKRAKKMMISDSPKFGANTPYPKVDDLILEYNLEGKTLEKLPH